MRRVVIAAGADMDTDALAVFHRSAIKYLVDKSNKALQQSA
jgi:hypothetical protein